MAVKAKGTRVSLEDYQRAQTFLTMVKRSRTLTPQQKSTLRGQALHGDIEGARKGYARLVNVGAERDAE